MYTTFYFSAKIAAVFFAINRKVINLKDNWIFTRFSCLILMFVRLDFLLSYGIQHIGRYYRHNVMVLETCYAPKPLGEVDANMSIFRLEPISIVFLSG